MVAYAGVPMRVADGVPIGTVCAIDHQRTSGPRTTSRSSPNLAASAAAELQLLAATRHAARHQGRVRTLAALSTGLVPAGSRDAVIDELAPVIDRLGASAVWLLAPDESGQALRTAAAAGADSDAIAQDTQVPLDAEMPLTEVVSTGWADFLPARSDVRDCFAPVLDAVPDFGSLALLPLGAREQCLGVLGVSFADERALSAEDREYLAAIAGVSGLALARAGR